MAKFEKRKQAEILRRKGFSLKEISSKLRISKSTTSIWCREIKLTNQQRLNLEERMIKSGHEGRIKGSMVNHERKVRVVEKFNVKGEKFIKNISVREKILVITSLYWSEGSKNDSRFSLSNSDPCMIKLVADILVKEMKIGKERLAPRLSINFIHKPRLKEVLNFWSNLLGLPVSQFGNPVLIKAVPKKIYPNHDSYYGTIALKVKKSSELKYEIMGYINALKIAGVAQMVRASHS